MKFSLVSWNFITANKYSQLFSLKDKRSSKYLSMNNLSLSVSHCFNKNSAPLKSSTISSQLKWSQVLLLETAIVLQCIEVFYLYFPFHYTKYIQKMFTQWLIFKEKHTVYCFIKDIKGILKWKWLFFFFSLWEYGRKNCSDYCYSLVPKQWPRCKFLSPFWSYR